MTCKVTHAGQMSESLEVKTGVRQGCLLSPFLFLLVIVWIMKTTKTGRNNGIQWTLQTQLDNLDFADDIALLSHNQRQMQDKTAHLAKTSAGTGLTINLKKMELMKINSTAATPVTVGGGGHPRSRIICLPWEPGGQAGGYGPGCQSKDRQSTGRLHHA